MELKGKRVTVVGLARSGVGAANLLARAGAVVTVTDLKPEQELADAVQRLGRSIKRALGGHPPEAFSSADLLVVSPGVPLGIGPIAAARSRGIPVLGELELAYQALRGSGAAPFLAVTGSNGKSTTTTLLDYMLRKGGFRTMLGGNIGNALTEEILGQGPEATGPDFVVAEVSSFQLEAIDTFRPRIAAVLNITPDHMDRYHSLSEYGLAKARIFENQGEGDYVVLNADDPETVRICGGKLTERAAGPAACYFSRLREVPGIYARGGTVYGDLPGTALPSSPFALIRAEEIRINGVHNLENAMAASAMALLAGCPLEAVRASLREFAGLEHRLEFVRELDGVRYINDSKGTNVGAVIKSLESFQEPLVLIAGGRDKAGEFGALRQLVAERVRTLVLIGEAAEKIGRALADATETVYAKDLREAVALSRARARKGDTVLLSPACASFDMFRDFEDRGRQFKAQVMELGR